MGKVGCDIWEKWVGGRKTTDLELLGVGHVALELHLARHEEGHALGGGGGGWRPQKVPGRRRLEKKTDGFLSFEQNLGLARCGH